MGDSVRAAGSASPGDIEDLVALRDTVEEWGDRATKAVRGFQRGDGSFWKDTTAIAKNHDPHSPHITTTARAFIGLLYADRLEPRKFASSDPSWINSFRDFVGTARIICEAKGFAEVARKDQPKASDVQDVNVFDAAHLADYVQIAAYLNRFYPHGTTPVSASGLFTKKGSAGEPPVAEGGSDPFDHIATYLLSAIEKAAPTGEICFEEDKPESRHYFATLHALRGLHVLKKMVPEDHLDRILIGARAFAIEQAFYFQRGVTHRQDPVRLAFAGCIYALYDEHVDRDVCSAIIEALAAAQQQNGSWPATHPIIRGSQLPWHIASHEVALCLTWLYFQPKVPDSVRPVLIQMMSRYFRRVIIPTFVTTPSINGTVYTGWQDDHTVSQNTAVGWATAIVCHFLANFSGVLNDWINRGIISELGLTQACEHLAIDETQNRRSLQWRKPEGFQALWPDLPPTSWDTLLPTAGALAGKLAEAWTDPMVGAKTCDHLSRFVLMPIFQSANGRPRWDMCAGLLPGQPGTRKTSLVKQVAIRLRWPMIPVPASLIFERGFDMMEAQASRVFGRLNHIRGCILFFDEFEEFFASRSSASKATKGGAAEPEDAAGGDEGGLYQSRTIAAFTTSAMLPRLQDLHDQRRCLIFLATNYLDKIDSAIRRRGRFDYTLNVNYPSIERLVEYIKALPFETQKRFELDADAQLRERLVAALSTALQAIPTEGDAEPDPPLRFELVETILATERPHVDETDDALATRLGGILTNRPPAEAGAPDLLKL